MKKLISLFYFLVFMGVSCAEEEKKDSMNFSSNEEKAEISFSFPSSMKEGMVKKYVEVIKQRLEFISSGKVEEHLDKREVDFSFTKGDLTDDDITLLHVELLTNFELELYDVLHKGKYEGSSKFVLIPAVVFIEKGKRLELTGISENPFLTLRTGDIAEASLESGKENGEKQFYFKMTLKAKSDVLEKKTEELSKRQGQIYFQFNTGSSGMPLVFQKVTSNIGFRLDSEYSGRVLEMLYKYPLPEIWEVEEAR